MAVGSSARPLLVPAADLLAKNMRALDASRVPPAEAASEAGGAPSGTRRTLIGLGAATEESTREARTRIIFRRAADDAAPGRLASLLAKLFPKKLTDEERAAEDARRKAEKTGVQKLCAKLLPVLEKASALASRLLDPTVLILALVLLVLLVERARPNWLRPVLAKVGVVAAFPPLFALALLWRKTELFATLREGQNPLSHPAEHRLDGLEAELGAREERVRKAQEELRKNRAQLDALRKELAKDPDARDPDAVIVPSRKAAQMIAAGALGAGYDAEAAQAVEQRRVEESVKRSREEWRAKTEEIEDNGEQVNVKLMMDHAATAYTKRTRELKTKSAVGGPLRSTDRLLNLRKAVGVMKKDDGGGAGGSGSVGADDINHRLSRQSEQSAADSTAHSTGSTTKRRLGLFRKKRRTTVGHGDDNGLQPSPGSSRLDPDAA